MWTQSNQNPKLFYNQKIGKSFPSRTVFEGEAQQQAVLHIHRCHEYNIDELIGI